MTDRVQRCMTCDSYMEDDRCALCDRLPVEEIIILATIGLVFLLFLGSL